MKMISSSAYIPFTLTLIMLFSFALTIKAEEITLLEVAEELQDGQSPIHDDQGRIYMRACKRVTAVGSNGAGSNHGSWTITSIAYSWVRMQALNENEDWNMYAEIRGTADSNTRQPPPTPNYTRLHVYDNHSAYAGRINLGRVCWIKSFWENFKMDQELSCGANKKTSASTPSENPFAPYSYAWGEAEWGQYPGGSVSTN